MNKKQNKNPTHTEQAITQPSRYGTDSHTNKKKAKHEEHQYTKTAAVAWTQHLQKIRKTMWQNGQGNMNTCEKTQGINVLSKNNLF